MELTPEQIEEQSLQQEKLFASRGYVKTATGSSGSTIFFLKKMTPKLSVHAMVFLNRSYVTLSIIGMLEYGISLQGMQLPLDSPLIEKTEIELITYLTKCLDSDASPATLPIVSKPKKEEVPMEQRNKAFWELIRQDGKIKGYEKEMCMEFYNYWTECTPGHKRVRWEKEATFQVDRRLGTWLRNDKKWAVRYTSFQEQRAEKELNDLKNAGTVITKTADLF